MSQGTVTRREHVRKRVLGAAVLLAVGVGGVFLATVALGQALDSPHGPETLLGADAGLGRVVAFSLLVFWSVLAPAILTTLLLRGLRWLWVLPFAVAGAALVGWGLLRSCAVPEGLASLLELAWTDRIPTAKLPPAFLLAYGSGMVGAVLAGGVVGAFLAQAGSKAVRSAVGVAAACAAMLAAAAMAGAAWQGHRTFGRLPIAAEWVRQAAGMGILMLAAGNAAAFGHVCAQSRPKALAVVLLATLVLAAAGWGLLQVALEAREVVAWGGAGALAAPASGAEPLPGQVSQVSGALRWCLLQWGAVLVASWGYLVALILLPVRRVAGSAGSHGWLAQPCCREPGPATRLDKQAVPPIDTAPPAHPGRIYLLLTLAYAMFFFYGSLVPLRYRRIPLELACRRFARMPWVSISVSHRSDLAANLLLSIPLMFFAMGAATKENRRRWARWVFPIPLVAAGTGLACAMEFAQLYFPARTTSLNDIAAQSVGGVVGVGLWLLFGGAVSRWARSLWRQRVRHEAAAKLLAGYLVGLAIYQFWPFELTISPAEVWHKLKAGRITLVPFTDSMTLYIRVVKIGLLVPVGYLAWTVGRSRGLWRSVGVGLLVAAGIELGQLFVISRFTSGTDVVLGTAGAALGAWLARHLSPRAPRPWTRTEFWRRSARAIALLMALVYAALLLWSHWEPFDFHWPRGGLLRQAVASLRTPLYYLYPKSLDSAAVLMARRFGSFFLLGVLVRGAMGPSRGGKWAAVVTVCAFALTLEIGQLFVSRVPDFATDTVNMALGGIVGAALAPWLRRAFLAPPADGPV